MNIPELQEGQLSDHDKEMLKVAEGGHPNDPSENIPKAEEPKTDFVLPEGFESYEALVEAAQKGREAKTEGEPEGEPEAKTEGEPEADDDAEYEMSDAERELRELKVYNEVGGKENYGKMVEFAKTNLPEDLIDVYNTAVNGPDQHIATFATKALNAMYQLHSFNTHGSEGELTMPAGGAQVVNGYQTQSDMMKDMSDPRYQSDPTFVRMVEQKLALSSF